MISILKRQAINNGRCSKKYAKALFDVSIDKDRLDLMYEELQEVSHATLNYIDNLKAIDSNLINLLLNDVNSQVLYLGMRTIT